MADVVPDTQQEFWRPPVMSPLVATHPVASAKAPPTAASCADCHGEFMSGSRFCYNCGAARERRVVRSSGAWNKSLGVFRLLGFQHMKHAFGLPASSLIGFFIGMGCVIAALAVGRVISVQNAAEFQALQLLRIEWLLGSVAAFLAAILLRTSRESE